MEITAAGRVNQYTGTRSLAQRVMAHLEATHSSIAAVAKDVNYAEDVRVRNKIIRETRKEALQVMNDDIDLEDIQGELEARAKFISTPLDRMVKEQEISSYETTVLEGHEETFLEDETMRIKIRYLSRGYIREVEVDLGRAPISE